MSVRTLHVAEEELVEAALWYEARRAGLGERFIDAYQAAILRIVSTPTAFPRLETTRTKREIRRCRLDVFPHYIPYEIVGDEIVILAVAHPKRRPNFWIRRK